MHHRTDTPNPSRTDRPLIAKAHASALIAMAFIFIVFGPGCKTAPKYETPATNQNVLERMTIREDNVDRNRWYYHSMWRTYLPDAAPMEIYIGQSVDRPQAVWLRLRTRWMGRRWAFMRGITINADGTRYNWDRLDFKRDIDSISYTLVHESIDLLVDSEMRQAIQAIIDSDHAVLRLRGERGTYDYTIGADERLMYQDILTAFDALQSTPEPKPN